MVGVTHGASFRRPAISRRQFTALLSALIPLPALYPRLAAAAATSAAPSLEPVRVGLIDLDPSHDLLKNRAHVSVRQMTFWQTGYSEARTQSKANHRRHADVIGDALVNAFQRLAPGVDLVLHIASPILEAPDGTQVIDLDQLAFAYDWMAAEGVRIVAQTFVGRDTVQLRSAMERATAHDLVVLSSAGNGAGSNAVPPFPAAYGSTIAITTTALTDDLAAEDALLRRQGHVGGRAEFVDYAVSAPVYAQFSLQNDPELYSNLGSSHATGIGAGILAALSRETPVDNLAAARALLDRYATPAPDHDAWGRGLLDPDAIALLRKTRDRDAAGA